VSTGAPRPTATAEEAESAFQTEVRANLPRNFSAHLAHGLLGQTGFRLINAPTFVPAYVHAISGLDWAVGLARGMQYLGMFLSPVMSATLIEHRRRVLPTGLVVGALMRVQVLGLALGGLFLPYPWSLVSALAFLGLFGFFLGMQGVIFNFLISKVIPTERRGFLLGLRNLLAGLTATGVAVAGGRALVETNALGNGYAATFLVAFALTAMGLSMLLFVREPETPAVREPSKVLDRLRELPELMRADRAFTRYFLARATATMGRMAVPFYWIYADKRMGLSGRELGDLTGVFVLSLSVTNLGWGLLADRRGFRFTFLMALVLWILSAVLLLGTDERAGLWLVFGALGAGLGGFQLSAQNLVLEFGSRQNLPMRIAVANSASELVAAVGALSGGVIAALLSYPALFGTAIAFQLVALTVVLFGVPEPRYRKRPRSS